MMKYGKDLPDFGNLEDLILGLNLSIQYKIRYPQLPY